MHSLACAVITAPRKVDLLSKSLEYWRTNTPFPEPFIVAEPGSMIPEGYAHVVQQQVKQGILRNWVTAAETLLSYTDAEYLMICEDDVYYPKLSWDTLPPEPWPEVFSLYTSQVNVDPTIKGWGKAVIPPQDWCGNLCTVTRYDVLEQVIDHPEFIYARVGSMVLDTTFGAVCRNLGFDIIVHNPSIVLHLGTEYSTMVPYGDLFSNNKARQPAI